MFSLKLLSLFNETELELLICGPSVISFDDWQANTRYSLVVVVAAVDDDDHCSLLGYEPTSPLIQWFWSWVRSLNESDRSLLLSFVTGTTTVPPGGFSALGYDRDQSEMDMVANQFVSLSQKGNQLSIHDQSD